MTFIIVLRYKNSKINSTLRNVEAFYTTIVNDCLCMRIGIVYARSKREKRIAKY